jgi:hypothetical protein
MTIKPNLEAAMVRLRIDSDLAEDLDRALGEAVAEAEVYLDGKLFASADDRAAAVAAATTDEAKAEAARGIVVTEDIHAAMMMLADAAVGDNDQANRESKRTAATHILRRHRNKGT